MLVFRFFFFQRALSLDLERIYFGRMQKSEPRSRLDRWKLVNGLMNQLMR